MRSHLLPIPTASVCSSSSSQDHSPHRVMDRSKSLLMRCQILRFWLSKTICSVRIIARHHQSFPGFHVKKTLFDHLNRWVGHYSLNGRIVRISPDLIDVGVKNISHFHTGISFLPASSMPRSNANASLSVPSLTFLRGRSKTLCFCFFE